MEFRDHVADDGQVEGLGHAGHLHPLGDAADADQVDHHDVDGTRLDHVAERHDAPDILAPGNRRGQRGVDPGQALVVVAGGDVLQPEQADLLGPPADIDRLLGAPALIDVAHQLDVGADGIAHHPHAADFLRRRRVAGQGHLGFHLDKPLVHQPARGGGGLLVGQAPAQRSAGIGRHPIAHPAEQLPQRLFQRVALDVPQRQVDRRQRQQEDAGGAAIVAGGEAQLAGDRLDAQRVVADDQRAEFVHRDAQRTGHRAAVERQADPLDPGIGLDAQDDDGAEPSSLLRHVRERIVFGNAEDVGQDFGDFHGDTCAVSGFPCPAPAYRGPIGVAKALPTGAQAAPPVTLTEIFRAPSVLSLPDRHRRQNSCRWSFFGRLSPRTPGSDAGYPG